MSNFTFLNMMSGEHDFEVHATGCRDVARQVSLQRVNGTWDVTADSADEAVAKERGAMLDDDMEWPVESFHVLPCARKL